MNSLDALFAFLVAAAVALVATPAWGWVAWRLGAVDRPSERGLAKRSTPRLGGVAIFAGVAVATLVFLPLGTQTAGILIGAAVITAVGALDDVFDLHPAAKLAGQVVAAAVAVAAGVRVDHVTIPAIGPVDLGVAGWILTAFGLVALMNMVNFIDGVDGLAAGICTISAGAFAVIALSLGRIPAGVLAALVAGAALGFLRHNFHPASVFMGDSGSNLLGFMLGVVAIQGVLKSIAAVALLFPLVVLAVPILDSSFVVAKRIKYRSPIYKADRWHLHHRFANIGFSQRKTVLYLYSWTLLLAGLALAIRFVPYSSPTGGIRPGWTALLCAIALLVVAASVYLVIVLEILKLRRFRRRQIWQTRRLRGQAPVADEEVEAQVVHELETGEFEIPANERNGEPE